MDIAVQNENGLACVALGGSLNTNTSSELEEALAPLWGSVESIVFDFSELDYISSAGLRVLMIALKRLGGSGVSIEHASDEVREVLDVTGFSSLFDMR